MTALWIGLMLFGFMAASTKAVCNVLTQIGICIKSNHIKSAAIRGAAFSHFTGFIWLLSVTSYRFNHYGKVIAGDYIGQDEKINKD